MHLALIVHNLVPQRFRIWSSRAPALLHSSTMEGPFCDQRTILLIFVPRSVSWVFSYCRRKLYFTPLPALANNSIERFTVLAGGPCYRSPKYLCRMGILVYIFKMIYNLNVEKDSEDYWNCTSTHALAKERIVETIE